MNSAELSLQHWQQCVCVTGGGSSVPAVQRLIFAGLNRPTCTNGFHLYPPGFIKLIIVSSIGGFPWVPKPLKQPHFITGDSFLTNPGNSTAALSHFITGTEPHFSSTLIKPLFRGANISVSFFPLLPQGAMKPSIRNILSAAWMGSSFPWRGVTWRGTSSATVRSRVPTTSLPMTRCVSPGPPPPRSYTTGCFCPSFISHMLQRQERVRVCSAWG